MSVDRFDEELDELLSDEILWYPLEGTDDHGNTTYSETPTKVDAYYEDVSERGGPNDTTATYGPGVSLAGTLWCRPVGISPRDKLELPDGRTVYALTATTYRNVPETGPHHQEIKYTERE